MPARAESTAGAVHENTPTLKPVPVPVHEPDQDQLERTRVGVDPDGDEGETICLVDFLEHERQQLGMTNGLRRPDAIEYAQGFLATQTLQRGIAHVRARVQHIREGRDGARDRLTPLWCWGPDTLMDNSDEHVGGSHPIAYLLERTIDEHGFEDLDDEPDEEPSSNTSTYACTGTHGFDDDEDVPF